MQTTLNPFEENLVPYYLVSKINITSYQPNETTQNLTDSFIFTSTSMYLITNQVLVFIVEIIFFCSVSVLALLI